MSDKPVLRSADIPSIRFGVTKWREGYDQQQVDEFLAKAATALAAVEAGRVPELTGDDVVNARFAPTKFREGYDQDAVDDFLDRVAVALRTAR
jgi:DivIVA domain-containing protein